MNSTEEKIANLLNRSALTVEALSEQLGISRNSVHLQVKKLEAAGVIEKFREPAKLRAAGKPAWSYRLIPGQEDAYSLAHKAVLRELVLTLSNSLPKREREKLLEQTGRTIASNSGLAPAGNLNLDIKKAVAAVNELGAAAEIKQRKKRPVVSCHTCPIASSVHADESMCSIVAGFFSQATGKHVNIECVRGRTVVCGFSFD